MSEAKITPLGDEIHKVCDEWVAKNGVGITSDWLCRRLLPLADRADAEARGEHLYECTYCGWRSDSGKMHSEVNWPGCSAASTVRDVPSPAAVEGTPEDQLPPHTCECGHPLEAHTNSRREGLAPCADCSCNTYVQSPKSLFAAARAVTQEEQHGH